MTGRSRFEYGLPPEELWGKAKTDRKHAAVQEDTGRWLVVNRKTSHEVKFWGAGRTTRQYK